MACISWIKSSPCLAMGPDPPVFLSCFLPALLSIVIVFWFSVYMQGDGFRFFSKCMMLCMCVWYTCQLGVVLKLAFSESCVVKEGVGQELFCRENAYIAHWFSSPWTQVSTCTYWYACIWQNTLTCHSSKMHSWHLMTDLMPCFVCWVVS